MEMDRQRSRFKDEVTLMGAENEELLSKNEELKNDIVRPDWLFELFSDFFDFFKII